MSNKCYTAEQARSIMHTQKESGKKIITEYDRALDFIRSEIYKSASLGNYYSISRDDNNWIFDHVQDIKKELTSQCFIVNFVNTGSLYSRKLDGKKLLSLVL